MGEHKMDIGVKIEWPDEVIREATEECNAIGMRGGSWKTYHALVKSGKIKGSEN